MTLEKMSSPFPVTRDDIAESIASSVAPTRGPSTHITPNDMCPSPRRPPKSPNTGSNPGSNPGSHPGSHPGSNPSTEPGSTRNTPPPSGKPPTGSPGMLSISPSMSPSMSSSRRTSLAGADGDSRRSSVTRLATDAVKDLRKGVRNVTDSTKKATTKVVDSSKQWRDDMEATTKKVKDKTADMGAHMKEATAGASKWTGRKARAAMLQARSRLSLGEKIILFASEKISALSQKGFTHVFMFLVLIGYTALGALLFMACEAPHEVKQKHMISDEEANLHIALWKIKISNFTLYKQRVKEVLAPYEDALLAAHDSGVSSNADERVWTFWKSMFFCSTITTTIGYGHITPNTNAGRALTIVYSIIGIPIFLILMADFGKLFTRLLKHVFIFMNRVYRSGTCRRARRHPTVQGISKHYTSRLQVIKNILCCGMASSPSPKPERIDTEKGKNEEKVEGSGFVMGAMANAEDEDQDKYFEDGNFNLPISLALFILILYMIMGCFIYISWENWSFFEAFYFIFVSMTTIGFGDYVPEHPAFMMATALYLVFGLALTAMCINIIQEKLSNTFREASDKLKLSFGKIMDERAAKEYDMEPPAIEGPYIQGPNLGVL